MSQQHSASRQVSADGDFTTNRMWRSTSCKAQQIHVGIIGGGFAGLRCADVLLQRGIRTTILEARDRLGGRVAQSDHLGHSVDLGPNWIHGTNDNPIMKLAQATGTELYTLREHEAIIDSTGETISEDETRQYSELLWSDGLIDKAFRHSNDRSLDINPNKSLYDFFVDETKELFTGDIAEEAERKRTNLLQLSWLWSAYIGSPVTRQSLRFFWLEECIEGENPFVSGTYRKILDQVAAPAREKATILLNTEVVEIHGGKAAESSNDAEQERPSIVTSDGEALSFDEIVVTTPLGWLKRNQAAFKPSLPPRLSAAIDNISYGHLDKVYITFPMAFWDRATGVTAKEHHADFTHFLQPSYASDTNPEQWNQECMNLAAMNETCAHPTLLFYIQGPQSKHIADIVKSTGNETERDRKLLEFFKPYYSRLPNYHDSDPNCRPSAVLATAWTSDKFAGYGAYSNFQVGLKKGDEDIETMRNGMPERGLWMAGEHTSPFAALGTSTGAYWSGEKVAERIAKLYALET